MKKILTAPVRNRTPELPQHRADIRGSQSPMAARDVPAGERWAFTDHRTMAEIIAEGLL
jgi:hypothetical protein